MKQLKEKGFTTIQVPVENNKEILTHAIKGEGFSSNALAPQKPGTFIDIGVSNEKSKILLCSMGVTDNNFSDKVTAYINQISKNDPKLKKIDEQEFLAYYNLTEPNSSPRFGINKILIDKYKTYASFDEKDNILFAFALNMLGIRGFLLQADLSATGFDIDKPFPNKDDLKNDLISIFEYLVLPDHANPQLLDSREKQYSNTQIKSAVKKWQQLFLMALLQNEWVTKTVKIAPVGV